MNSLQSSRPHAEDIGPYKLATYAWPGGYSLVTLMEDGEALCIPCSNGENGSEATANPTGDGWGMVQTFIHWEGFPLQCAHCNKELESEYDEGPDQYDPPLETLNDYGQPI